MGVTSLGEGGGGEGKRRSIKLVEDNREGRREKKNIEEKEEGKKRHVKRVGRKTDGKIRRRKGRGARKWMSGDGERRG